MPYVLRSPLTMSTKRLPDCVMTGCKVGCLVFLSLMNNLVKSSYTSGRTECVYVHMSKMQLPPVWSSARKRKQVGHTNRLQLQGFTDVVAESDLLGQAQVERSVRAGLNATLRSIRTGEWVLICASRFLIEGLHNVAYRPRQGATIASKIIVLVNWTF